MSRINSVVEGMMCELLREIKEIREELKRGRVERREVEED